MGEGWKDFGLLVATFLVILLACAGAVVPKDKALFTNPYYGQTEVTDRDCQMGPEDPPKFIHNNQSVAYYNYFSLSCVARYPVTVDFEGVKPFYAKVTATVGNASPKNNSEACFILNLGQHVYYQNYISPIGNFTCKGVTKNGKPKSSLLTIWTDSVYRKRDYGGYGLRQTFVVQDDVAVFINNKSVKAFWIPCAASKPDIKGVVLKKYSTNTDSSFLQLDVNKFPGFKWSFDKFLGFRVEYNETATLKLTPTTTTAKPQHSGSSTIATPTTTSSSTTISFSTSVTGTFYCDSFDGGFGNQQSVDVQHSDFLVFPNQTNLTASDRQMVLECHAGSPITFKVRDGSTELKELKQNDDVQDFKSYGYSHGIKSLFKVTGKGVPAGIISCVEDSSGKTLFSWKFDNAYICQCDVNSTSSDSSYYYNSGSSEDHEFGEGPTESSPRPHSYDWAYYQIPYRYAEVTCVNNKAKDVHLSWMYCGDPLECKMKEKACSKNERTCDRVLRSRFYDGGTPINRRTYGISAQPGIIQCNADGYVSQFRTTNDVDGHMYMKDSSKLSDIKSVSIKASETHVFIGDKMVYSCRTAPETTMGPVVWAFQFDDDHSFNYSFYDYGGFRRYNRYGSEDSLNQYSSQVGVMRTTFLTIPTRKASKLWCFVPKWNSTQWLNSSIELDIEDADITQNPPNCPDDVKPMIVMYRNSTLSKARKRLPHRVDGKDAVFVFDPVNSVSLYCLAKYPVRWMKDGMNMTTRRQARANCRQKDGTIRMRYLYKTTVVFDVNSFNATGNYTCAFTQHNAALRQTSTYIYAVSGPENRTTFVDEGKHYLIKVPWLNETKEWEEKKWVVLPCRTNQRHFTPYLFIDYPLENRIERVSLVNKYLKFESKVGFTIDVSQKVKGNMTTFFCSDHRDGSFIGTMFTVELIYEPRISATVSPTKQPISAVTAPNHPETSTVPGTPHPIVAQPVTGDKSGSGNTGFIISIIVLSAGCMASIAIIYRLLQKTKVQEKKLQPSGQEFDWTRASQTAASNHSHNADDEFKGIASLTQETPPTIEPIPDLGTHFANLHNFTKSAEPAEADLINSNGHAVAQNPEETDRSVTEVGFCDFRYQKL